MFLRLIKHACLDYIKSLKASDHVYDSFYYFWVLQLLVAHELLYIFICEKMPNLNYTYMQKLVAFRRSLWIV